MAFTRTLPKELVEAWPKPWTTYSEPESVAHQRRRYYTKWPPTKRNFGAALLPAGVTIYFPSKFEPEECRKWLRKRGIKLTSGRWGWVESDSPMIWAGKMVFGGITTWDAK